MTEQSTPEKPKLVACECCEKEISNWAILCPHCGNANPKKLSAQYAKLYFVWLALSALLTFVAFAGYFVLFHNR